MVDKVLAFLKANAGLTEMVQPEPVVVITPKITSTLTPATGTAVVPYKEVPRVTQIETFTFQGRQVWCVSYSDATWERILDANQAYQKCLELFPAGPPRNH